MQKIMLNNEVKIPVLGIEVNKCEVLSFYNAIRWALKLGIYRFDLSGVCGKNDEIVKNRDYYQGARGIPSPLLIKRYLGKDPIEKIAHEILALSKMNWNGAQLYSTMPVTLDFSSDLACMSKQSEQLPNKAFDFRLFI